MVCSPFFCLKKMRAAPAKRETARIIKPATKPKKQYTMMKPRMAAPTAIAAHVI